MRIAITAAMGAAMAAVTVVVGWMDGSEPAWDVFRLFLIVVVVQQAFRGAKAIIDLSTPF
jgi:hypothetical protein